VRYDPDLGHAFREGRKGRGKGEDSSIPFSLSKAFSQKKGEKGKGQKRSADPLVCGVPDDINPAAKEGKREKATGFVCGETSVIDEDVSIRKKRKNPSWLLIGAREISAYRGREGGRKKGDGVFWRSFLQDRRRKEGR